MAWLPREGLPSRCPGCTSSTEAEAESESWKTENSPTFKYFCKESWEAFCTSSWRWLVLSKDCILFCSYLCGIKFYSQLQVDFLPSSFPTKSTVLSQDICGRELHDSFITHFFFSFLEAVTSQHLLWMWIFWVNFTTLPAGHFVKQRESYGSFILLHYPNQSTACSADQNNQHSQLNQIWPDPRNQDVKQTIRQSDFPEGTLIRSCFLFSLVLVQPSWMGADAVLLLLIISSFHVCALVLATHCV